MSATEIRRIELRLSLGKVAEGLKLLREFARSDSLSTEECEWAIQALSPYGEDGLLDPLIRRLTQLKPGSESVQLRLADSLRESGHFQESQAVYRQVLATNPRCGRALYCLSSIGALREEDLPEQALEGSPEDQAMIQFARGKIAEDSERFEQAMHHFDLANGIAARNIPPDWKRFDRTRVAAEDHRLKLHFTAAFLNKWSATGLANDRSIFVVGMPRSGTSLLERMLAGHPEVHAGGELSYWTAKSRELIADMQARPPRSLPLAESYERLLDTIAPEATKFVNKNPMNAKLVGPLHVLMPNARFVWCSRHPVDNCLSMYKTFGGAPKDMAFSKRLLVDGFRLSQALKEHWAKVMPAERFLEITYEQLVTNNVETVRHVIEFCGLEWSDRCLGDRSIGSVRTPSSWQVRQPIYTSSVNSWRHYEPWLAEFRELL